MGAKVSFDAPGITKEQFEMFTSLAHVSDVERRGNLITVKSTEENGVLEDILSLLRKEKIEYTHIYSEMPTLNDVFLELTGKELRD